MPKRTADDPDGAGSGRTYLTTFGTRVRVLRIRQGLTLKQVSQRSGLSDRYLIAIEKGQANPSLGRIWDLARALQTSVTGLLDVDSKNQNIDSHAPARQIVALLEKRPIEQLARVISAVSEFLEDAKGKHIALIGMRGAGKTTVGGILAERLRAPFYELDELIEKDTGLSLGEIFELEGEQYYRSVEEKTLQRTVKKTPGVIAAGGGLVMNPNAFLLLKLHAFVVWLQASPDELMTRVRNGKDDRRLTASPHVKKQLKAILARRTPVYGQADLFVSTERKSPEMIVNRIIRASQRGTIPRVGM